MISAGELARKAAAKVRTPPIPYLLGGRSDRGTDCINMIGWCVQELGGRKEDIPRGSNTAWRQSMQWTGTLQEARMQGRLVPGALVYIKAAPSAQWPDGDYEHVGVYVGNQPGWAKDQVIVHASYSRDGVFPSTLKNAWTHAAWLKCVDYTGKGGAVGMQSVEGEPAAVAGVTVSSVESSAPQDVMISAPQAVVFPKRGQVTAGGGLRMRKTPKTNGEYMLMIPAGSIIDITAAVDGWYQTHWANASGQTFTGWVSSEYVAAYEQTQPAYHQSFIQPPVNNAAGQPIVVNVTMPTPPVVPKKPNVFRRIINAIRGD
ncbi:hypothetical protein AGMMS49992_25730 [Clostridia bacterium]|nr:hypothetical protein AGMMS49992_25730 [Clostridia bacterium]